MRGQKTENSSRKETSFTHERRTTSSVSSIFTQQYSIGTVLSHLIDGLSTAFAVQTYTQSNQSYEEYNAQY